MALPNVTFGSLSLLAPSKTKDNDKNTEIADDSRLLLVVEKVSLYQG
jgi:hypothetical protein